MKDPFVVVEKVELLDGEEMMELAKKIMSAIAQNKGKLNKSLALQGIFKDHIVVRDMETGKMYRMKLARSEGGEISLSGLEQVRQTFVPVKQAAEKAVWSTAVVNDLPDSSFLYIAPGGRKDADGKTVPRSLRYFPVKDAEGKVDLPHVRNALARIPQANIPQAAKDAATAAARKLLEAEQEKTEKRDEMVPIVQAVDIPSMSILLCDGKISEGSIEEIEECAKAASDSQEPEYIQISKSRWAGIL